MVNKSSNVSLGLEGQHVLWSNDYILCTIWQMLLNCNDTKAINHYNNELPLLGQSCCSLDSSTM